MGAIGQVTSESKEEGRKGPYDRCSMSEIHISRVENKRTGEEGATHQSKWITHLAIKLIHSLLLILGC